MTELRRIRVQCALPGCFAHFLTPAAKPRAYCTTEHAREGGRLNSITEVRRREERARKDMAKNRDLAEQYADLVCPECGSSLDYDEDVVFCTDRYDCSWSQTVAQIRKSGVLQLPSAEAGEDGQEDERADEEVRVVDKKKKKAPDAPKKAHQPVEQKVPDKEESLAEAKEEQHGESHSTPIDLDIIAKALSCHDPRVIEKVCKAAILMRQAMDMLSAAKGEI